MIDEVIVFTGSKRDFNSLLQERIDTGNDEVVSFMELIQHYNARIHPTESGVKEIFLKNKIGANCLVCKADDFGSVLEHTLLNFTNIISLNYDVEKLFVHNPPKKVLENLQSEFVERFPELSLFFKAYSLLDSEMICIFPYFCPYAESAREIREIFS